jgi:hypothetical protein
MTPPLQLQDLVAELVHAHPSAKLDFDPLPSGVCFLWLTVEGRNFCLEYHPTQGTGVSENVAETPLFSGHDHGFAALEPAIKFFKQIVAKAAEESLAVLAQ